MLVRGGKGSASEEAGGAVAETSSKSCNAFIQADEPQTCVGVAAVGCDVNTVVGIARRVEEGERLAHVGGRPALAGRGVQRRVGSAIVRALENPCGRTT
jgi:predicted LPLAT superfamily acyltransferase